MSYTEQFIQKAVKIHNDKYDYTLVNYKNTHTKVTIICPIHGNFDMKPNSHISSKQGCPKCANKHKTLEDFVIKSNTVHHNKYDYSKFKYINTHTKGIIICPIHGEFEQSPASHQSGQGCKRCGYVSHVGKYSDTFFSLNPDKCNESAMLYAWEIYNDSEQFIKVGITTTNIKERIKNNKTKNYKIIGIIEVELPLIIAYNKEQQLLQQFSTFQYFPTLQFRGRTECLLLECKDNIIKSIMELKNEQHNQKPILNFSCRSDSDRSCLY